MQFTRTSVVSGITRTQDIPVKQEELNSWVNGSLIQVAMPQLSVDEREFIMTGITPDEWNAVLSESLNTNSKFWDLVNKEYRLIKRKTKCKLN